MQDGNAWQQVSWIKQMVDNIILQGTNVQKIYICSTLYRSSQDGIGSQANAQGYVVDPSEYKYDQDLLTMDFMQRLYDAFKTYANVIFIPLAPLFDSEYNYTSATETELVNPRAVQTEQVVVDSIHPQDQGHLQIADILYSVFCGTF